ALCQAQQMLALAVAHVKLNMALRIQDGGQPSADGGSRNCLPGPPLRVALLIGLKKLALQIAGEYMGVPLLIQAQSGGVGGLFQCRQGFPGTPAVVRLARGAPIKTAIGSHGDSLTVTAADHGGVQHARAGYSLPGQPVILVSGAAEPDLPGGITGNQAGAAICVLESTQGIGCASAQGHPALFLHIPLIDGVVLFTRCEKAESAFAVTQEAGGVVRAAGVVTALYPCSGRASGFLTHG